MRQLALSAISLYQRRISPHKGFCCAYSADTGHGSCSVLGYRAVRRHGVLSGFGILLQRFERCSAAQRRVGRSAGDRRGQQGFCDVGCDLPSGDCVASACDAVTCCDCGDWGSSRKKANAQKQVYVPPPRWG